MVLVRGDAVPCGSFWGGTGAHDAPGGHGGASLLPHPRYSAVPTGCEQMVTKLTGCKQLRRAHGGTRYSLHAFSFGNKRCLPAQEVCCGTLPLPIFLGFFFKALQSSSRCLGLKSIQLSGLPAHNFFHSKKGKTEGSFHLILLSVAGRRR